MHVIGWTLVVVLSALAVRFVVQRRKLEKGQMRRCPHCNHPYEGEISYCPHCGEVLRHGSFRR